MSCSPADCRRVLLTVFLMLPVLGGGACPTSGGGADAGLPAGAECTRNADCTTGHCVTPPNEPAACRAECGMDGACPAEFACTGIEEGGQAVRVCLPVLDQRPAGTDCVGGRQCASGVCAPLSGQDAGVCVEPCPNDETCPTNTFCSVDHRVASRPFCMPPLDTLPQNSDCEVGRECVGGRCVPWGGRMRCATSCVGGCADGSICGPADEDRETFGSACVPLLEVGDFCLRSVECGSGTCYAATPLGQDAGLVGTCVGNCGPDSECPEMFGCVLLEGQTTRSCVPVSEARPLGDACGSALECASGRCARFAAPNFDAGTICAEACDAGACSDSLLCWGFNPDAGSRGLCGPQPL